MRYNDDGGFQDANAFGKRSSIPAIDPAEAENRMLSMVERTEKWNYYK